MPLLSLAVWGEAGSQCCMNSDYFSERKIVCACVCEREKGWALGGVQRIFHRIFKFFFAAGGRLSAKKQETYTKF